MLPISFGETVAQLRQLGCDVRHNNEILFRGEVAPGLSAPRSLFRAAPLFARSRLGKMAPGRLITSRWSTPTASLPAASILCASKLRFETFVLRKHEEILLVKRAVLWN